MPEGPTQLPVPAGVVSVQVNEPECRWTPKTIGARCSSTVQGPLAPVKLPVPLSMSRWYGTPVLGILAWLVLRPTRVSPAGLVSVKVPVPLQMLLASIVPQYTEAKVHGVPSFSVKTSSR